MAIKDIVKGICSTSRCKYDVYTKEKIDEMTKVSNKDYSEVTESGVYIVDCHTMTDSLATVPMPYKMAEGVLTVLKTSNQLYGSQCVDIGEIRFIRNVFLNEEGEITTVGNWKKTTLTFEEISNE